MNEYSNNFNVVRAAWEEKCEKEGMNDVKNLYKFVHPLQIEMEACSHCVEATAELFDRDLNLRHVPKACRFHQPAVCLICYMAWNEVTPW